jgi:hypothetical protein
MNSRFQKDRRLAGRYRVKTPLRVREWKSAMPEHKAVSVNLSQRGIYFATDWAFHEGETVEVFFNMPEEVAGEAATEWRCTGHVVRVEVIQATGGKLGVGVQFDCYEVSRSKPVELASGMAMARRMMADTGPRKMRKATTPPTNTRSRLFTKPWKSGGETNPSPTVAMAPR